jgi:aminopeptidase-like protein
MSVQGFRRVPFRQTVGNDETVWEAPGYEIPIVQINRCQEFGKPFPEYHSSLDTPDLMQVKQLEEAFRYLQDAISILETNAAPRRNYSGLMCLSNPKYGLYRARIDPSVQAETDDLNERWGYFQDCVVRYMEGTTTILEIAERYGLPYFDVLDYLRRWADKGLLALDPFRFHQRTTMHDSSELSFMFSTPKHAAPATP